MNVLSLFDGISVGKVALDRAGIKVDNYFASEIKSDALKVSAANHPTIKQLGDVTTLDGTKLPKIDLLIGGSPCFIAGTQILTLDNGYQNIEDVNIGDYVLSHTGNWRKVLKTGSQITNKVREVKGYGNPSLITTDEHPFYTKYRAVDKKKDTLIKSSPNWTEAQDLTQRHYCSLVSIPTTDKPNNLHFWYMIGRYTGDGWYRRYKRLNRKNSYHNAFIICCGHKEFDELNQHFKNFGYHYNYIKERTGYKFRIYDEKLVHYVMKIGKGASNKIIHPDIWKESIENIKSFIQGMIDSDGSYSIKRNLYQITTTSQRLSLGLQQLIQTVYNVPVARYYYVPAKTIIIEGRTVNQRPIYNIKFKLDIRPQDSAIQDGKYSWCKLKSNESRLENTTVYNLEVDIDNSYTANNIVVHNCQNFSRANKSRKGLSGDKSKLFYEYLRILKEVRPKYFLLENVIMEKVQQDIISYRLNVEPIRINSSLVSAALRDRLYWTNIPNVTVPADRGITLQSILTSGYTSRFKARALLESDSRPLSDKHKMWRRFMKGFTTIIFENPSDIRPVMNPKTGVGAFANLNCRYMNQIELERCMTLPDGYTATLSRNKAAGVLGDSWTVDVIAHIFKGL